MMAVIEHSNEMRPFQSDALRWLALLAAQKLFHNDALALAKDNN